MIRRILHISALALGLVLAGCSAIQEENYSREGLEIQFTASVGTFQVKATDTGFEPGDQIGLFADSPVSASNVRMTWDGTNLVPESRLFWTPGDERRVGFSAYYPYDPEKTNNWSEFFVNADQSTKELFTASDFMTATSAAKASDGVVNLIFYHRFSKVIIHIENTIPDMKIADVYLGNVRGRVEGDPWGNYSTIGQPGAIKTCKAATPAGETVWAAIVPAQYTEPQLMITTADGKQYTYEASRYGIDFMSGCCINAHVTIGVDDIVTDFTSDVTEWTDNNDLEFPIPGREKWSIIGTVYGSNWDQDFPLENCYKNTDTYYTLLYCNEGDKFKLRKDASWVVNRGLAQADAIEPGYYSLQQDGADIQISQAGVYEVFWNSEYEELYICTIGKRMTWTITGSLEGMDWSGEHWPDGYVTIKDDNGVWWPLLAYRITCRAGQEFKFWFGGDWFLEYGLDADWDDPYSSGDGDIVNLRKGGPNIQINEDGIYWVYFDPNREQAYIYWEADLPEYDIMIDGDFSDWDTLDSRYVYTAYGDPDAPCTALNMMKAYADEEALYVYFEYDLEQIHPEPDVEFVPFHIYINSDCNDYTGGWLYGYWQAGVEYCLESFLYYNGKLGYAEGGLLKWSGEDCEAGWDFDEYAYGVSSGAGNGKGAYEVRLDRNALPLNDSFTIGIDIQQNWDAVGRLPNTYPTDDNPSADASLLFVKTNYEGQYK